MKYSVYAIADDPYCSGDLHFEAEYARLENNNRDLVISPDGANELTIHATEGFRALTVNVA